jgi:hypothetical protein
MKQTNYSVVSHTNPELIDMDKVNIGPKGLVKYSHPKYGKTHVLVMRMPVCTLDKYPIEHFTAGKSPDEKVPVNLKLSINETFTKNPFYTFLQKILEKYENKSKCKTKYPVFDSSKKSNYIKIKFMDCYNSYTITEIINEGDIKLKTKQHKPSSIMDLYSIFSQGLQVVPFVMLYFYKTDAGDFVTLRPVKFYIGKNITIEQIEYISKKSRYVEAPKSDFFDSNQQARPVSLTDFLGFIKNTDQNDTRKIEDIDFIC